MQLTTLLPLALAALISAQDINTTTTAPYSNPATTLLTQTNSLGVITGQPAQPSVITSQPDQPTLATSQPAVALVPAGFTSGTTTITAGNQTFTVAVNNGTQSLVRSTPTPTTTGSGSGSGGASGSASGSGSAASSSSTGAAAAAGVHFKAGMGALAGAAGVFAIFL